MTIRQFAKECGIEVKGKLRRRPECEEKGEKVYEDEAEVCYIIYHGQFIICTEDGVYC